MIPVYYVEDASISCISIVNNPAIEEDFVLFNKQIALAKEGNTITGPILIPEQKIYRRDDSGEYYLVFSKDAISRFGSKLLESGCSKNVSLSHNGTLLKGIRPIEVYLKDSSRNSLVGFEDLPDGTLFVTYVIEDESLKERVKDLSGFSIEASIQVKKPDILNKVKTTR